MFNRTLAGIVILISSSLLSGCAMFEIEKQQEKFDQLCSFEGQVATARTAPDSKPVVAFLARRSNSESGEWQAVDRFVMERPGRWGFLATAGEYRLGAFADENSDLAYQESEPFATSSNDSTFTCVAGARFADIEVQTPVRAGRSVSDSFTIGASAEAYPSAEGYLTAVGEIVSLDDPRFSLENASNGLWRPYDSRFLATPGVYFLEPYDPRKTPVLFVHGISDTPKRFAFMVERLDRTRFQPWLYYYPSGIHLDAVVDHLTQTMTKLRVRFDVDQVAVVAHSIGGLVARAYLQREVELRRTQPNRLLVTISTPWEGHQAAEIGVKYAPTPLQIWHDIAPASAYLKSLFAQPLPAGVDHRLFFSYGRDGRSRGVSSDESVTVASQLSATAQQQATKVYGFDETHRGMLDSEAVAALVNELLSPR